jgi:glucose-1-phosphate cytidylyltransferase
MKVAILAGGAGKRLIEETEEKPKPLVEIGGRPILWHIMMHYSHYDFRDFVVALGYKGELIKEYVLSYSSLKGERLRHSQTHTEIELVHDDCRHDWRVQLVDTGMSTRTGGRIKRLAPCLGDDTFMLTWSDGVSDVNLHDLLAFHRSHGKFATLTAVHPPTRFGHVELHGDRVVEFCEKPIIKDRWINGAFFVLEPAVLDYIDGDDTQWEKEPLERLAKDGQLMAFRHTSFWQCMDTLYDKRLLEELWQTGNAPWRI